MILSLVRGEALALTLLWVFVLVVIGVPITVLIVRDRRHTAAVREEARYAHMDGWAPGTPDFDRCHAFGEVPGSPHRTLGPRIIAEEVVDARKRVWIAAGEPPSQPDPWVPTHTGGGAPQGSDVGLFGGTTLESTGTSVSTADDADSSGQAGNPAPGTASRTTAGSTVPEVRVMGRVEVVGWREEPDRKLTPELACFLAMHADRRVPGEEIRAAVWPGDLETTEASMQSLYNAISILRHCLGAKHVPGAAKGSGYRLAGVESDWGRFTTLVESAGKPGADEVALLTAAMELVRGTPFEGVTPGTYTWAWTELLVARMEKAIASAAVRLSSLHLDRREAERASWAVLQGLMAAPYDRALWSNLLTTAAMGGRSELERAVKHASSVLGKDITDLEELIERLRRQG